MLYSWFNPWADKLFKIAASSPLALVIVNLVEISTSPVLEFSLEIQTFNIALLLFIEPHPSASNVIALASEVNSFACISPLKSTHFPFFLERKTLFLSSEKRSWSLPFVTARSCWNEGCTIVEDTLAKSKSTLTVELGSLETTLRVFTLELRYIPICLGLSSSIPNPPTFTMPLIDAFTGIDLGTVAPGVFIVTLKLITPSLFGVAVIKNIEGFCNEVKSIFVSFFNPWTSTILFATSLAFSLGLFNFIVRLNSDFKTVKLCCCILSISCVEE
ncbi:hypothetical protein MYMA111404_04460 [Mycoplasma marinum]